MIDLTEAIYSGKKFPVNNYIFKIRAWPLCSGNDPIADISADSQKIDFLLRCLKKPPNPTLNSENPKRKPKQEMGFFSMNDYPAISLIAFKPDEHCHILLFKFDKALDRGRFLEFDLHFEDKQVIRCKLREDCKTGKTFNDYLKEEPLLQEKWYKRKLREVANNAKYLNITQALSDPSNKLGELLGKESPPDLTYLAPALVSLPTTNTFSASALTTDVTLTTIDQSSLNYISPSKRRGLFCQKVNEVLDLSNDKKDPDYWFCRTYLFKQVNDSKFRLLKNIKAQESRIILNAHQRSLLRNPEFNLNKPYRYNYDISRYPRDSTFILDCEMAQYTDGKRKIVSLAILDIEGKVLFNKTLKPRGSIKNSCTALHGIPQEDINAAQYVSRERYRIEDILNGAVLVGYAIHNDLQALKDSDIVFTPAKVIDIQKFRQFKRRDGSPVSLAQLVAEVWQRSMPYTHKAVADARATLYLYKLFKDEIESDAILDFSNNDDDSEDGFVEEKQFEDWFSDEDFDIFCQNKGVINT